MRKIMLAIIGAAVLLSTLSACGGPSKPTSYTIVYVTARPGDVPSTLADRCMPASQAGPFNAYQSAYMKSTGQLTNSGPRKYLVPGQQITIMISWWSEFSDPICPRA